MGRHKQKDSVRVFDVSKPGRSTPSPTARPVIVNHRQVADDPMITGEPKKPAESGSELMTHSKPVVPISVASGDEGQPDMPAPEDKSAEASTTPEMLSSLSAPVAKDESPSEPPQPSSVEPFSGSQENDSASKPPEDKPTDAPQVIQPLPAELVSPEADDPVGLSSSAPANKSSIAPAPDSAAHDGQPSPGGEDKLPADAKSAEELPAVPENIGEIETLPLPANGHQRPKQAKKSKKWLVPAALLLVVAGYLIMDAGLIGSGNMPFQVFKEENQTAADPLPTAAAQPSDLSPQANTPKAPLGFSQYALPNTKIAFSYPTAWGPPAVSSDAGFSKRGGGNQSDGVYAYLINFEINKDIQLAVTSKKYLSANRPAEYYDFLQWCSGTHDQRIYRQKLLFEKAGGVDTPTTITCSDGPVAGASAIDGSTIMQADARNASSQPIGDIYTKNLTDAEFVVIRAKDSTRANSEAVKNLLSSIKVAGQP